MQFFENIYNEIVTKSLFHINQNIIRQGVKECELRAIQFSPSKRAEK